MSRTFKMFSFLATAALLIAASVSITACSAAGNTIQAGSDQNTDNSATASTQSQQTATSTPAAPTGGTQRPFSGNGGFTLGIDTANLSRVLGINQDLIQAAFTQALNQTRTNLFSSFGGNFTGTQPPPNFGQRAFSGNGTFGRQSFNGTLGGFPSFNGTQGGFPSFNGTQGGFPSFRNGSNPTGSFTIPDTILSTVAEILGISTQELQDAITETQ